MSGMSGTRGGCGYLSPEIFIITKLVSLFWQQSLAEVLESRCQEPQSELYCQNLWRKKQQP